MLIINYTTKIGSREILEERCTRLDEDELKALVLLNRLDKVVNIAGIISEEQSEEIEELQKEIEDLTYKNQELRQSIDEYMTNEDE